MPQIKIKVTDNENDLLKDAAGRMGNSIGVPVSKQKFIEKLLNDACAKEYELQQIEAGGGGRI